MEGLGPERLRALSTPLWDRERRLGAAFAGDLVRAAPPDVAAEYVDDSRLLDWRPAARRPRRDPFDGTCNLRVAWRRRRPALDRGGSCRPGPPCPMRRLAPQVSGAGCSIGRYSATLRAEARSRTKGRSVLSDPEAQWSIATTLLIDRATLLSRAICGTVLLLQAGGWSRCGAHSRGRRGHGRLGRRTPEAQPARRP